MKPCANFNLCSFLTNWFFTENDWLTFEFTKCCVFLKFSSENKFQMSPLCEAVSRLYGELPSRHLYGSYAVNSEGTFLTGFWHPYRFRVRVRHFWILTSNPLPEWWSKILVLEESEPPTFRPNRTLAVDQLKPHDAKPFQNYLRRETVIYLLQTDTKWHISVKNISKRFKQCHAEHFRDSFFATTIHKLSILWYIV